MATPNPLSQLWRRLTVLLEPPTPTPGVQLAAPARHAAQEGEPEDARRRSIRDVTREQLGLAHWSCHTHF